MWLVCIYYPTTWTPCKNCLYSLSNNWDFLQDLLVFITLRFWLVHSIHIITSHHSIFINHFKDLKGLWCRLSWTRHLARGRRIYFPLTKCHKSFMNRRLERGKGINFPLTRCRQRPKCIILSQRLGLTRHSELDSHSKTFNYDVIRWENWLRMFCVYRNCCC